MSHIPSLLDVNPDTISQQTEIIKYRLAMCRYTFPRSLAYPATTSTPPLISTWSTRYDLDPWCKAGSCATHTVSASPVCGMRAAFRKAQGQYA